MTHAHAHGHHDHDHGDGAFAKPGHDHRACARDMLARATRLCAERGARLTEMRRRVLEALADSHAPAGAYEVIERVTQEGARAPAPITVYRALDFLVEQGFVHRIESRNAFVACSRDHGGGPSAPVVFLICETCSAVGEASTEAFGKALTTLARGSDFSPKAPVIEISGECGHCRARRTAGERDAD